MVEPAILKAVQRVQQRHVEEATHLPNDIDGEQADDHPLENKKHRQVHSDKRHECVFTRLSFILYDITS